MTSRLRGEFQKYFSGSLPDLTLRAAQLYLTFADFHPGPIDGLMGSRTRAALLDFQHRESLEVTGDVDDATATRLKAVALG
jgi:peptidoglycan hydrolase-like protein with peptidoglycan-binding domain